MPETSAATREHNAMTCKYCRAHNEEDAHRCHRCGRRLDAGSGPFVEPAPASRSAAARELQPQSEPAAPARPAPTLHVVPPPAQSHPSAEPGDAVQASLFGPQEVARAAQVQSRTARAAQTRARREKVEHPTLDFDGETVRTLKTSVAAAIYCDAPVALPAWRAMAAIVDTLIGVTGVGVFALVFHLAGFSFDWTKQTAEMLLAALAMICLLYRVLFCFGNGDTLGLRATNLRLVDVGGHLPKRRDRFYRLGGGCISFMAVGIGLLWALFDEERLTWHDHMSNTFPTLRSDERMG